MLCNFYYLVFVAKPSLTIYTTESDRYIIFVVVNLYTTRFYLYH